MIALRFARKPRESVGLDIGTSTIKAVQLREGVAGFALVAFGSAALRPDVIAEGSIKEPSAVAEAIREAVSRAGITSREVTIGVAGRELITKKVQLPEVPAKELRDAVELEAEHHIPFAFEDVLLDYHVASRHDGVMDLIIVAVKKTKVSEYIAVVEEAGLVPVIVDVDGFAVANQFELNHPEEAHEAVALIDVGATVMKTSVVRAGAPLFARDIPFGGNQYTQAIADRLRIPFEQAELAKLGEVPDIPWERVAPALEAVSRDLALEVRRTFDYFGSTSESDRIGRVVISGGAARLRGLTDYLSSTWSIPVEIAHPLGRVDVDSALAAQATAAGPALAVAVGLALRHPGERSS
jgi:type IV pilus assembly protein PilM